VGPSGLLWGPAVWTTAGFGSSSFRQSQSVVQNQDLAPNQGYGQGQGFRQSFGQAPQASGHVQSFGQAPQGLVQGPGHGQGFGQLLALGQGQSLVPQGQISGSFQQAQWPQSGLGTGQVLLVQPVAVAQPSPLNAGPNRSQDTVESGTGFFNQGPSPQLQSGTMFFHQAQNLPFQSGTGFPNSGPGPNIPTGFLNPRPVVPTQGDVRFQNRIPGGPQGAAQVLFGPAPDVAPLVAVPLRAPGMPIPRQSAPLSLGPSAIHRLRCDVCGAEFPLRKRNLFNRYVKSHKKCSEPGCDFVGAGECCFLVADLLCVWRCPVLCLEDCLCICQSE
jgi:hypothetical protein